MTPPVRMDHVGVEVRVRDLLETLMGPVGGWKEEWQDTPRRVASLLTERFAHMEAPKLVTFGDSFHDLVLVRNIPFDALCSHHLLPYFGRANVAYIPSGKVVGLSKIARVVRWAARYPRMQEEMTSVVADTLHNDAGLAPVGVLVTTRARHLCMEFRGVQSPEQETIITSIRGRIDKNEVIQSLSLRGESS